MEENKIEIETVSIDDVLKDYSIANSPFYSKYIKFNPPVECTLEFKKTETPEEMLGRLNQIYKQSGVNALAEALQEEGLCITNISYSFPDSTVDSGFTENVAFIGNTLRWGNSSDN